MKPNPLVWYDAGSEADKCSYCHGLMDQLKKKVIVHTYLKSRYVLFHEDCYDHYFSVTNHDGAFPSNADWPVPVRRYFARW